ncbi:amino acid adenylation domain-containing protein [Sphingomonas koreensis]|nr:amino acid adenylation domain-containing protein [Sphingomonas koreensis]
MTDMLTEEGRQRLLRARLQRASAQRVQPASTIPRRPASAARVLTPLQRQLWFLQQLDPDSAAYNVPAAYRITGALDADLLAEAIARLAARHEILRTSYPAPGGDPIVDVAPAGPRLDQRTVVQGDAEKCVVAEASRSFDLASEPPMRAILWRVAVDQFLLLITWHHIAVDGQSASMLLRELADTYATLATGDLANAAEPPLQFADVAAWRAARDRDQEVALQAWHRHLDGALPLLDLPTERPRQARQSHRGRMHRFALGQEVARALDTLCDRCGATAFQVLTAALALLCARDAGQDDVVLGAAVSRRERSEIEDVPGCFVNTIALRNRIRADSTARSLIATVRKIMIDMADYMDLPLSHLLARIVPERQPSYSPVFQVLLSVNSFTRAPFALPGLRVEELAIDTHTAKFDLSWAIDDISGDLVGSVTYDTTLFGEAAIARMVARFATLLRSMAADPDAPAEALALLPSDERRTVLALGEATEVPSESEADVIERFVRWADASPEGRAVRSGETAISYGELDRASSRIANFLRARGVGTESLVPILLARGPGMIEAMLGVLKAGAAYIPIDPDYPPERIATIIDGTDAELVLSERALAPLAGPRAIAIDTPDMRAQSEERPPYQRDPRRLMYLLFTSGSTGRPKGVAIEHGGYVNYLSGIIDRLDPGPGAQFGLATTFCADLGTTMVFGALTGGGCLHIIDRACAADPIGFAAYLDTHPLDFLKLVPGHFELLASMGDIVALLPKRCLIFAGEALPADLVCRIRTAAPGLRLENHYGPTETTVAALVRGATGTSTQPVEPIGRPLPGVRFYILDDALEPVPTGITGELYIGGAGVARGYHGQPGTTARAFIPDPFSAHAGGRLYATGDLARMDTDGTVYFIGRRDRQVKIRGFRIEIGEIESVIASHAAVGEARVMLRPGRSPTSEKQLVAYYTGSPDVEPELRQLLAERLPEYMRPAACCALDAMPRTANGKLDEAALPEPQTRYGSKTADQSQAPRTPTERRVAAAWSIVLGYDTIGIHEDFFRAGGDSFRAVRAVRELGDDVRVMDLFAHPTIARLAAHIDAGAQNASGVLHRLTDPAAAGSTSWVCVPFGGGGAISYLSLADHLAPDEALYAIEIPGHDYARRDEPLRPFDETVQLCVDAIEAQVPAPMMLYGHCLGAALAVAIALELERRGVVLNGVAVGGAFPAPRLPGRMFDAISQVLPTDALISRRSITDGLMLTGGANGDEDPQELEFLVRNMRHDGREAEQFYTRFYRSGLDTKLRAPLLCVVGARDRATEFHEEEVEEWTRFADHVTLAAIPRAGHFFQKHQAAELARLGSRHATDAAGGFRGPAVRPIIAPGSEPTMSTLRAFLLTTFGQIISTIGSGLSTFALGVWIYQQTHIVSDFALLVAVGLFPGILVLPFAGVVADQWDRRKIMLACDSVSLAVTAIACALAFGGRLPVWVLYTVAGTSSVTTAFRQPAYLAAMAQLVPKRYLGHATGLVQIGSASGIILSQAFGGILIALLGLQTILGLDVASYAIAIVALVLVRFPNLMFKRREEPFFEELSQGWRFILKRRGLVGLMLFFALGNALASIVLVLVTPIVLAFASAATLGLVMAANGIGMLVGSLVMAVWGGTRNRINGLVGFVALFGLSAIVLGLRPAAGFPIAGMIGIGLCTAFINAHWLALIQVKTGMELQGRVLAANQVVARSLMPIGTLVAGWLADRYFEPMLSGGGLSDSVGVIIGTGGGRGAALLVILAGICSLALTALGLAWQPLRRIEQELPDAIPDREIEDKNAIQTKVDAAFARQPALASSTMSETARG